MALLTGEQVIICVGIVAVASCVIAWLVVDYLDNKSRREAKIQMKEMEKDDDKN